MWCTYTVLVLAAQFLLFNASVVNGETPITDFKAAINNDVNCLTVGQEYEFEVSATSGTNISITWYFEPGVNITDKFLGEFSSAKTLYSFSSPGEFNISVIARNSNSTMTDYVLVMVMYGINDLHFDVENEFSSTTQNNMFSFTFKSGSNATMNEVIFTINYQDGGNASFTTFLNASITFPYVLNFSHQFHVEGHYLVEAEAENCIGSQSFTINMTVMDTPEFVRLKFFNSIGKHIENATTTLILEKEQNTGLEYSVDYGDNQTETFDSDEILDKIYSNPDLSHNFTLAGLYSSRWTSQSGEQYDGNETFVVLVQTQPNSETLELESIDYPWINIQANDLPMDMSKRFKSITIWPCLFEPDTEAAHISDLIYKQSVFAHFHCYFEKDLKAHELEYGFTLCVQKYSGEDFNIVFEKLVPLNASDSVTVDFHVKCDRFDLIPHQDDGTWTYTDFQTDPSYLTTFQHEYTLRHDFIVNFNSRSHDNEIDITPPQIFRAGVIHLEINTDEGFINMTEVAFRLYGILGKTEYNIDFDDGTTELITTFPNQSESVITQHIFSYWGTRTVRVIGQNSTFTEIAEAEIRIDNPIGNLTVEIPRKVFLPAGHINMSIRMNAPSPDLPFLTCVVSMADPIIREPLIDTQNVTYDQSFRLQFQYVALGVKLVEAHCWNLISETWLESLTTVVNKDFLFTGIFDRQYSQLDTPVRLSSMNENEITSRLVVLAPFGTKTSNNIWMLPSLQKSFPNRQSIFVPQGYLQDGTYLVNLSVNFVEEPGNKIWEPMYLDFASPPPHSEILGGRKRVSSGGQLTVDAYRLSYDQVDTRALTFEWECKSYTNASLKDLSPLQPQLTGKSESCVTSNISDGIVTVDTVPGSMYALTVTVISESKLSSSYTQYIEIKSTKDLTILCRINCLSKVAVTSDLQFVPEREKYDTMAKFQWHLHKWSGSDYSEYINLDNITKTGSANSSLTIKGQSLEAGAWYLVTLELFQNIEYYGPAYYEFVTNEPPRNGSCRVIPYDENFMPYDTELNQTSENTNSLFTALSSLSLFNLTCKDWLDEGFTEDTWTEDEPLFYFFFLQNGTEEEDRQILHFEPGATSPLVTFQVGDASEDFRTTAVLQVIDIFGDYAELRFYVISKPFMTTEQLLPMTPSDLLTVVKSNVSQFDDQLLKANRSCDYRNLALKIKAITSVYNAVTGEKYVLMLKHSIMTWPEDRRISIIAVEALSRALSSSLSVIDYSSINSATVAAECINELSKSLVAHWEGRRLPNSNDVLHAAQALLDLIRNCLSVLQAILTPNLPSSPTVDEMRNYLQYIKTFATEAEGMQQLSLQEETFLAQKQLQKFKLQKYLKAEASKEALPLILRALSRLTEIFSKMVQEGQREMYIENDFVYVSAEISPAYYLRGMTLCRPYAAVVLDSLSEITPTPFNTTAIDIQTIIFKHNPYYWGEWADRISSVVPTFVLDGAILTGDTVRFIIENPVEFECVYVEPTYAENSSDHLIHFLLHRQHTDDDLFLYIKPETRDLNYQVYFNEGVKPSIEDNQYIYGTELKDDNWTIEDGYRLHLPLGTINSAGTIWIALRPMLGNSFESSSLLKTPICVNVTSVSCLALRNDTNDVYKWNKSMCKVSAASSKRETICDCENLGETLTVGTTFYVPPNKLEFIPTFLDTDLEGNTPVIAIVIALPVLFVLMILWAWREDVKDKYKWSYELLLENDIADKYFYLIRVHTGIRRGSGTKSKVGFVLVGENGDTGIRIMDDVTHMGFETGSIRNFVLSTRKNLGDLLCLRIWHDDSGSNQSAWFLSKVHVIDLETRKRYIFKCNEWLDFDRVGNRVDRVLVASALDRCQIFREICSYVAIEYHLWISVFVRPLFSSFTRVQRIACILVHLYLTMIICTLFLKTSDEDSSDKQIIIEPFRISMENFLTALISVSVTTPMIIVIVILFKNTETSKDSHEHRSCLRKGYRCVNEKLTIDKSVIDSDYIPPTHVVVRYFHVLPHFCKYVSWTILGVTAVVTANMLMVYSFEWNVEKSHNWLTVVFLVVLLSAVVTETMKVLVIAAVTLLLTTTSSLFCNKAYRHPEPDVDIDRLKEIARRTSVHFSGPSVFGACTWTPQLPDRETLEKNQRKRMNNHQLLQMFVHLLVSAGLLYIVYMISFYSRDPQSYRFKQHIQTMMNFDAVEDTETYIQWMKTTFIQTYFNTDYFGVADLEGNYKAFTSDIANVRVGPARLRQLRIRKDKCKGPLGSLRPICYNEYADWKIETTDNCIGWKNMPCDVSEEADFFSSPAWKYHSSDEVWGFPTLAQYTNYMGGGYFMKLDVNRDSSIKIFDELIQKGWIDRQTRAVILELTVYNSNTNLFCYSKSVAEFPEIGGVIPYSDIQIFRLHTKNTILFFKFIFVIGILASTVFIVLEIFSNGYAFFKIAWNWLDLVALAMSYTTISAFIVNHYILRKTISVFKEDTNAYVGFENLAFYDSVANTTHSILVFLLSVRVSRVLGYSGKINEMAAVITKSAVDLGGFCVVFGVTYIAYVLAGTLLFGRGTGKYRDVFHTYATLTEAVIGKNRMGIIQMSEPMLAELYYFTFVLFVLMTLVTMAAAILNFSISHVKEDSRQMPTQNIVELLFEKLGSVIDKLSTKRNRQIDGKDPGRKRERRRSSEDLTDILSDLKIYLRGVASEFQTSRLLIQLDSNAEKLIRIHNTERRDARRFQRYIKERLRRLRKHQSRRRSRLLEKYSVNDTGTVQE